MSRRFTANVWTRGPDGVATEHVEGSIVPDGLAVGDHCWTEVEDDYLAYTGDPEELDPADVEDAGAGGGEPGPTGEDPVPPPLSGPGASRDAWRDYYTVVAKERPPTSWTRDDLIQALRTRRILVA